MTPELPLPSKAVRTSSDPIHQNAYSQRMHFVDYLRCLASHMTSQAELQEIVRFEKGQGKSRIPCAPFRLR